MASITVTTPPKKTMNALQRAMMVHEFPGELVDPNTKVNIIKEEVKGVPGAYVLKNVRFAGLMPWPCMNK